MESAEIIAPVKDNAFARQFETIAPEGMLTVEYSFQEKKIFLTKINTPEGFDNQVAIDNMLKSIMELNTEKKFRVVPIHPKIVTFFKKNPKYKELLPPGIRI
ncbi:N-acetyltransferase [Flavobacterium zhairuonense]|uniref:N-acetyltransferase n=1 Tax=Flavobacterium zhairuonense TaxID=2493631 RepID=UPI00104D04A4|nr:N-acetyltransferase [Flavobacterium zhairuonense]KAF2513721.1 N-acetyltransferase [Flavobacterium zhairuonense]